MAADTIQQYQTILKALKDKKYAPIYFLYGEEAFFIDAISKYIENNVLGEAERGFNQTILYGKDIEVNDIVNAARRFPMMAEHQVIIVKEAQNIKKIAELEKYAEAPLPSTILVICYKAKTVDKRTRFAKMLDKHVLFESKPLYDNKVLLWVEAYVAGKGYKINPKACLLLVESLGSDLAKIANELDKVFINIETGKVIDVDIIEENVGISKNFNSFELTKALAAGDKEKAYRIISYFASDPVKNPLVVQVGNLYRFFSNIYLIHYSKDKSKMGIAKTLSINPFFADEYIAAARRYSPPKTEKALGLLKEIDLKSKGIGSNMAQPDLMKEMIVKLMQLN